MKPFFTLDLRSRTHTKHCPVSSTSYDLQSLKLLCPKVYGEMHLQEVFDLSTTLGQGYIKHCPLHHVTYVPAKIEVATTNGQGFTRKFII